MAQRAGLATAAAATRTLYFAGAVNGEQRGQLEIAARPPTGGVAGSRSESLADPSTLREDRHVEFGPHDLLAFPARVVGDV